MIEQLIPLGELGILFGIYQRIGQLRHDTDKNNERIDRLKKRLKGLERTIQQRSKTAKR